MPPSGTDDEAGYLTSPYWKALLSNGAAQALEQVQERILQLALLSEPRVVELARFWDMYAGRHQDELRSRLTAIGLEPSENLMTALLSCLRTWKARKDCPDRIDYHTESEVFERYRLDGAQELRCEVCGYHFRDIDLSTTRLSTCESLGLGLARYLVPHRDGDPRKPVASGDNRNYYTALEIDHIIPKATLGPSDATNLGLLCRFCNLGKSAYLLPFEGISQILPTSIQESYSADGEQMHLMSAVAAIRQSQGQCAISGKTRFETELTVRIPSSNKWLAPWNLQVVSYDTIEEF